MESRAALRYAKAVLDLAVQKKAADKVDADMRVVLETFAASSELQDVVTNPVVKIDTKKNMLLEIFKATNEVSKGLIITLSANKRIEMLQLVAEKYSILYEKMKGEAVARVTSAVPLGKDLEKKILAKVEKITGNRLAIENTVDETIIGGFILRVGDMQYDASLANKLVTIKREFTNSL